jgi:hypothetical protein
VIPTNFDRNENKVRPCICGVESSRMLYEIYGLSPQKSDVILGSAVMTAVLITVVYSSKSIVVTTLVFAPVVIIITVLAIYRLLKRHDVVCSFRWGYFVIAGMGRFLPLSI